MAQAVNLTLDGSSSATSGHVLYMMKTAKRPYSSAAVITEYVNTTGKCLSFLYYLISEKRDGHSSVSVIDEEERVKPLTNGLGLPRQWNPVRVRLPHGLHRVKIVGHRYNGNVGLAVDSVSFESCPDTGTYT